MAWHGLPIVKFFVTQAPQEVKWEQYKDVEPVVLDAFKSAMASASPIPCFPSSLCICMRLETLELLFMACACVLSLLHGPWLPPP